MGDDKNGWMNFIIKDVGAILAIYLFTFALLRTSPIIADHLFVGGSPTETSVLVDAILSALLIVVYQGMWRTQTKQLEEIKKQSEAMATQSDIMLANHLPVLTVEGYSPDDERENLGIMLSNQGNGIAKNLKLKTELTADEKSFVGESDLLKFGEPMTYIEAGEETVFDNSLRVKEDPSSDSVTPFQKAVHAISLEENSRAELKLTISFEDVIGNAHEEEILSLLVELDTNPSIEGIFTQMAHY